VEAWPGGYKESDIINAADVASPIVLSQGITLPAGWTLVLDSDSFLTFSNALGEPVGQMAATTVADAAQHPVPTTTALVGNVLTVTIDATRATLPLTIDPYVYRGGRVANGGYTYDKTADKDSEIDHVHIQQDSCTNFGCSYVVDARYSVALRQTTAGLRSYATYTSVTVQQIGGRPAGYANGLALNGKFHCRVNLADDYDYFCDQARSPTPPGADPPYEQSFPGYPTSKSVGPVPQYLPPKSSDTKHHYFYEVTIVPRPPEDRVFRRRTPTCSVRMTSVAMQLGRRAPRSATSTRAVRPGQELE